MTHHAHAHAHGHSHGLVDPGIKRSRAGLVAVGWSLLVLGLTALAQTTIFVASGSVALLADLIHNFGDAATAFPLAVAFALRSARAERWAGLAVVFASSDLDEVRGLSDTVATLFRGHLVRTFPAASLTTADLLRDVTHRDDDHGNDSSGYRAS